MLHLDRPAGRDASGPLDRTMPVWLCALILIAISIIPTWYVARHYSREHGLTELILFGSDFKDSELPEVKALHPAILSTGGYDGQFYAQLAMDPTMRRPDLKIAVVQINYRCARYLPILLSYIFGFGRPAAILTAYVLINLVAWFGLVALLTAYLRGRTPRQYACLIAAAMTTGALICIERSLGDLPGTTFVLGSTLIDGIGAAVLISLAVLCKPTFLMAAARYAWPMPADRRTFLHRAGLLLVVMAAPLALRFYLRYTLGPLVEGAHNLGWPFASWVQTESENWRKLMIQPFQFWPLDISHWEWRFFEFIAPISLLIQATHLAIWRNPRSPLWWLGATFAVLFICLGQLVTVEEIASARTVLPLTVVFNLRLAEQRGGVFWGFFIAGNFGLLWCWHDMVAFCLR
jgi:hypothetical protein